MDTKQAASIKPALLQPVNNNNNNKIIHAGMVMEAERQKWH